VDNYADTSAFVPNGAVAPVPERFMTQSEEGQPLASVRQRLCAHVPETVERRAQLRERGRGAERERDNAKQRGQNSGLVDSRPLHRPLHELGGLRAKVRREARGGPPRGEGGRAPSCYRRAARNATQPSIDATSS
jgi:hypothetical protein